MSQINIHVNETFERELKTYMTLRHVNTKSEALRLAVRENLQHILLTKPRTDFSSWVGAALPAGKAKKTKILTDDEIWETHDR